MADIRDILETLRHDINTNPDTSNYVYGEDDQNFDKAVAELEQLIKEKQVEARLKERKRMSQDLEEFSDWAFVNYPEHELEKAIKSFWRENADRIAELEGEK